MAKVTKINIVREISIEEFLPINMTEEIIDSLFAKITKNLANGNTVTIPGFGKFEPIEIGEKKSNLNGKLTVIPPRVYPKFTAGAALKRAVVKEIVDEKEEN